MPLARSPPRDAAVPRKGEREPLRGPALQRPASAPAGAAGATEAIIDEIEALLRRLRSAARHGSEGAGPAFGLAAARQAIASRRRRDRLFGSRLFAESAWDMLLDLFVAQLEGRTISVASACIAASASTTTALRHIAHLTEAGLISRTANPDDSRSTCLQLTDSCAARLAEFFRES
jgi:winged helix DNA-binding protein